MNHLHQGMTDPEKCELVKPLSHALFLNPFPKLLSQELLPHTQPLPPLKATLQQPAAKPCAQAPSLFIT